MDAKKKYDCESVGETAIDTAARRNEAALLLLGIEVSSEVRVVARIRRTRRGNSAGEAGRNRLAGAEHRRRAVSEARAEGL